MKQFHNNNYKTRKLKNTDRFNNYSHFFQENSPMFSTGFMRPMKNEMIKNYSFKDFSKSEHKTN